MPTYDLYVNDGGTPQPLYPDGPGITSPMTGATSSVAGASGLVPAPAAGDQGNYLKGDGTWGGALSDAVTGNSSTTGASSKAVKTVNDSLNTFKNGNGYVKNTTPTVEMSIWWDDMPHFKAGDTQGVLLSSYINGYETLRYGPLARMDAPSGGTWECIVLFIDGNSSGNMATALHSWSFIGKYAGGTSLGYVPSNTYAIVFCRRLY